MRWGRFWGWGKWCVMMVFIDCFDIDIGGLIIRVDILRVILDIGVVMSVF